MTNIQELKSEVLQPAEARMKEFGLNVFYVHFLPVLVFQVSNSVDALGTVAFSSNRASINAMPKCKANSIISDSVYFISLSVDVK